MVVWQGVKHWRTSGGGAFAGQAQLVPVRRRVTQASGLAPGGKPPARRPRPTEPVVNVSSYSAKRLVLSGLFPLAYAAVFMCLLLQAFRMMRLSSASTVSAPSDRTGLKTIHPELLDENGVMTNEELWAVRFSEKDGVVFPEA